ncbi:hypothetical protein [Verrucomicrobium sp. BvORR034]|uniref:hypothetical protein n=1 Tax=Verrucomicrobium sp. BvORR034 TaxID=1396418 RepID=UPI000678A956|nr:hypothetical protein [Verrucomicrobium sp. BvORR034]
MPKFFSTVVFLFGGLMMVVVAVSMVQRYIPWGDQPADTAALIPPSDLPPLDLGTQEEFHQTLDRLYTEGGLPMVQSWVESQLVPGRTLLIADATPTRLTLIDREVRPCDRSGALLMNRPASVPRRDADLRLGPQAVTVSWNRLEPPTPYALTTWSLPVREAP